MGIRFKLAVALFVYVVFIGQSFAEQINVAVASNALAAIKVISLEFEKQTGHSVRVSSGSTGKLYAQIVHGAPYDIFLAANEREPSKLEQSHLIVPDSRFTYALGKLVVWSPDNTLLQSVDINKALSSKSVMRIAIANPKIAPYGLAAKQTLQNLGAWDSSQIKLIRGENISQTYQYVVTGNAQIGFVAKSQINATTKHKGSYWDVPEEFYAAIRQQAVLLSRAQHNAAAIQFIEFMKSTRVKDILIGQFGYGIESTRVSS